MKTNSPRRKLLGGGLALLAITLLAATPASARGHHGRGGFTITTSLLKTTTADMVCAFKRDLGYKRCNSEKERCLLNDMIALDNAAFALLTEIRKPCPCPKATGARICAAKTAMAAVQSHTGCVRVPLSCRVKDLIVQASTLVCRLDSQADLFTSTLRRPGHGRPVITPAPIVRPRTCGTPVPMARSGDLRGRTNFSYNTRSSLKSHTATVTRNIFSNRRW